MKQLLLLLLYAGFSTQQIQSCYPKLCALTGNLPQRIQAFKSMLSHMSQFHLQQKLIRLDMLNIHTIEATLHEHQIVPIMIDEPLSYFDVL